MGWTGAPNHYYTDYLQMTLPAEDGSTHMQDILTLFLYIVLMRMGQHLSLFI